jgi:hypothetical protein
MSLSRVDQADLMLMDNKGRPRDLVLRLHEAGSTGLDLSPGDPLCREAAFELGRMRVELAGCEKVRDEWCKEFTEQRDDAEALVKRCADLEALCRRVIRASHHEQPGVIQEMEDYLATSNTVFGASKMIIHNGDHAQFEIDNADVAPKDRPDWPLPSFDAKDWAEAFNKRFPAVSVDDAIGWFANALMRGYDERTAR